jgi:hypothetical protein
MFEQWLLATVLYVREGSSQLTSGAKYDNLIVCN